MTAASHLWPAPLIAVLAWGSGSLAQGTSSEVPAETFGRASLGQLELAGHGGIHGRICHDRDGDGACSAQEPPAARAVVFLEDGSHVQADARGRFHFAPVRPGWHLLLAGPGPLALGLRPGSFPALPRQGSAKATVRVEPGQYHLADLALPLPPGADPATFAPELDQDERPAPGEPGPAPDLGQGAVDEQGALIGFLPRAPGANAGRLPAFPPEEPPGSPAEPARAKVAVPAGPGASPRPSTALLGLGEGRFRLDLDRGPRDLRLVPESGRLALILQDDFGDLGRATVVLDTQREGREQTLLLMDPLGGYPELGHEAHVAMSTEEKLYLRLDMPSLSLQGGRMGVAFRENELLFLEQSYLGVQASYGDATFEARGFAGFSGDPEHHERLVPTGSLGPYLLGAAPVLAGSERVEVEIRSVRGDLRQRIPLRRGVDYFLDFTRGRLHLARPWAPTNALGDEVRLSVRYQRLGSPGPPGAFLAGGRAQLGGGNRRIAVSLLRQEAAEPFEAVAVDARYALGPVEADLVGGLLPFAAGPAPQRGAGRVRLTARLADGIQLFALGASTGEGWIPRVRGAPLLAGRLTPLDLLDAQRLAPRPLPSLTLLREGLERFPLLAGEERGWTELGGGARIEVGPVRAISLHRRLGRLDDPATGQEVTELATVGNAGPLQLYAGHATLSAQGEGWGPASARRLRQTIAGLGGRWTGFHAEVEYRHLLDQEPARGGELGHGLSLKARLERFGWLQPAILLGQTWRSGQGGAGLVRHLAAGLESQLGEGFRAYAYASAASALGARFDPVPAPLTGLAGLSYQRAPGEGLNLRYQLRPGADGGAEHHLSWDARLRPGPDWTVHSDGDLRLGGDGHWVRLSTSYAPPTALRLLARAEEELDARAPVPSRTRLAAVDLGVRLGGVARLDGKWLVRWRAEGGSAAVSALGGAALSLEGPGGPFLVLGGRYLRDAFGGAPGGYLEAGLVLGKLLRVGAGFNLAARSEVFAIANQSPGFYLAVSAADAAPLGARALPAPEAEAIAAAPAPTVRPAPEVKPPEPVRPPPPRVVSGRLYGDRNGNGTYEPDEPVFEGVKVAIDGIAGVTDAEGRFRLEEVPAERTEVRIVDRNLLPLGYLPAQARIASRTEAELVVELHLARPRAPAKDQPLRLVVGDAEVQAIQLERATFPLASWVAGLPLTAQESKQIGRLSEAVLDAPDLRLVVVAHAQTMGPLAGAVRRAWRGGRLFKRYLQAAQTVPGSRVAVMVIEPDPGEVNPVGHVDLILVRIPVANR